MKGSDPAFGIVAGDSCNAAIDDVADAVVAWHDAKGTDGKKEYIPFPDHLKGAYQSFTEADISNLRAAGYTDEFFTVEQGVNAYLDWLNG